MEISTIFSVTASMRQIDPGGDGRGGGSMKLSLRCCLLIFLLFVPSSVSGQTRERVQFRIPGE